MLRQRVPLLSVLLVFLVFAAMAYAGRNSGGTYSLPAGNPVVTGTTITSSWANGTLSDLATEITNSLDRQGRGSMLAPLKLSTGTAPAPAVSFSIEPSTGIYRAALNDPRFSIAGTDVWKWGTSSNSSYVPLSVTGRTTTTDLTVTGTAQPIAVVSTTPNLRAISATGSGSASGVNAFGGTSSGAGVSAIGGAPNGVGVSATGSGTGSGISASGGASGDGITANGGSTAGYGIRGTASAAGYAGIYGLGSGAGSGILAQGGVSSGRGITATAGGGNAYGIYATGAGTGAGISATGGASGPGIEATTGTASTSGTRQDALLISGGDIHFNGVIPPAFSTAVGSRLTPNSYIKAWGQLTIDPSATTVTIKDGLNIASATTSTTNAYAGGAHGVDTVNITFASPFSTSQYAVIADSATFNDCEPVIFSRTGGGVRIVFRDPFAFSGCAQLLNGPSYTKLWVNGTFTFIAIGAQ